MYFANYNKIISQNPTEKIFTMKNIQSKIDFIGNLIKMALFR